MCNEYGTSNAVPEICGIDRDDYCGCSGCVYLYPIYGIYLWWEEINKIIKNKQVKEAIEELIWIENFRL